MAASDAACMGSFNDLIYGIRFLQGLAESSTFVGTHYILGSWYKPGELGKRSGIFTCSGLIGTLFSGLLQAAVYQWLFIIDSVITFPIALYGFLVFPDVPATTKAFYLSEEEILLANERIDTEATRRKSSLTWNSAKRILGRWRWYGCSLLFAISGETESFGSNNLMGQWMKAIGGYTVEQTDYYPSGLTAFGIASTLICATLTDATRSRARWPVLVWFSICCLVASIILLTGPVANPVGLKFFAWYISGASYAGQATTFAWANQICHDDDLERGVVLASMNMWNNVVNAWWSIVFYPATDAPRFQKGLYAMIGACIGTLLVTYIVWYLERRESERVRRRVSVESDRYGSAGQVEDVYSEGKDPKNDIKE
ncbi:hypothetical protein Clacol_005733 [Clathrus columnatus]|uniref:MFS general substrate transporter n=1 Tax=Clathrus columnatus TaxID=1419009 RepID=A0AAV5AHT1_9AGAM|nr:hypothetical protein Clacol_005733 [Clathrus columnatus]